MLKSSTLQLPFTYVKPAHPGHLNLRGRRVTFAWHGLETASLKRAHRVMDKLNAGVMWANAHHRNSPDAPWGGFGASGIGRENGLDAHREYTASKTMIVRTAESKEDWFAAAAGARYG